jgi:hypothetical protein
MNTDERLIELSLSTWRSNVDRISEFFSDLTDEQLQREVSPGRNRLIYLLGHLTGVNDSTFPLLGLSEKLHPDIHAAFVASPDRSPIQDSFSGEDLKCRWKEVNESLWVSFATLSAPQWLEKHTAVSAEDFQREPHRNRYAVLLRRTGHLSYHLGQATLVALQ